MKIHINYAHGRYVGSQKHCCETALQNGFDVSKPYGLQDLDSQFLMDNAYTMSHSRGVGCWLWKPYLILKTMETMANDDWLMYTDSGMTFLRNPWDMIAQHEDYLDEKGIAFFGGNHPTEYFRNKWYTKRDTFVLMQADDDLYTEGRHLDASVVLCKKTSFSISFLEQWLSYAQDPRILTDLPNTQGKPNYPEFRDHRHDQSIASLLAIRHGIVPLNGITQWGNDNPYILHHRNPA